MNVKELEQKAQSTLSNANLYSHEQDYLKAIAYFLWAILKTLQEKRK